MNNIELLKGYLDSRGEQIVPILFADGKYLCSYPDGSRKYLKSSQIFEYKKEFKVVEPEYFEEQLFEVSDDPSSIVSDILFDNEELIDNKKVVDTGDEDDFFKDFM